MDELFYVSVTSVHFEEVENNDKVNVTGSDVWNFENLRSTNFAPDIVLSRDKTCSNTFDAFSLEIQDQVAKRFVVDKWMPALLLFACQKFDTDRINK